MTFSHAIGRNTMPKRTRRKSRSTAFEESPNNPYRGLMAAGWEAFHKGQPKPFRGFGRGKQHAFYQGWIKAKLAQQQRKRAM